MTIRRLHGYSRARSRVSGSVPAVTPPGKTRPAQDYMLAQNAILGRAASRLYRAGVLPGDVHATILGLLDGADHLIRNPPRGGSLVKRGWLPTCWDAASSSQTSVVVRWIYGGGHIGTAVEALLGDKQDAGKRTPTGWLLGKGRLQGLLDYNVEDLMHALGLKTIDCPGYFTRIRKRIERVEALLVQYDVRAGELAQAMAVEAREKAEADASLRANPDAGGIPWLLAFGALVVFLAIRHSH